MCKFTCITLFTVLINKSLNDNNCATLKKLSQILNKRFKNPTTDIVKVLLDDIETFNDIIWEIREAIRDGNQTVTEDIKPIINVTLPSFVQTYETLSRRINKPKRKELYQKFNFTDEDRRRFKYLCADAKFQWETLQVVYDLRIKILILNNVDCGDISVMLRDLDKNLTAMLLNPQPNAGDQLLTSIDDYTCLLWEIRDEIRTLNMSLIEDVKSAVSTRLPEFIRTYKQIDKSNLYKIYNWKDRKEKRLNYLILDSKHLWKTMVELHNRRLKEQSQSM